MLKIEIQDLIVETIRVYGKIPLCVVFAFIVFEVVALLYLSRNTKKREYIKIIKWKFVIVSFVLAILLFFQARANVDYSKVFTRGYTCSLERAINEMNDDADFPEVLKSTYKEHYLKKYGVTCLMDNDYDKAVICEDGVSHIVKQSAICFCVVLIGYIFSKTIYKGNGLYMPLFLAAPMGSGIVVIYFMLHVILGWRFSYLELVILALLFISGLIYWNWKKGKRLEKLDVIACLVLLCLSITSTSLKWIKFAGDCQVQLMYALAFIKDGTLGEAFTKASTFGFFGISLHSLALMFGEDYFYSIFFVVNISVIGVGVITLRNLMPNIDRKEFILTVVLSLTVLALNFDFENYSVWMLSNSPVAGFLCIIVACTFLSEKEEVDNSWIIAIASFVTMVARVEGVCYVMLSMCVPLCRGKALRKTSIIVSIEIIAWQIVQAIHYSGDTGVGAWNEKRGMAFVALAIVLLVWQFISCKNYRIVKLFEKNYPFIFIGMFAVVIGYAFFKNMEFAVETSKIMLFHFAASRYSNSLAFWIFIAVLLPIIYMNQARGLKMGVTFGVGYYMLIWGISLYRVGNPFHIQISDSLRRMIFQGMLVLVWLINYLLMDDGMEENNGR